MKKQLVLLGLLTFSLSLFSMEKEQNTNNAPKTHHLSTREKVKVAGALLGCAFFTTAAILNPRTREATKNNEKRDHILKHVPSIIALIPMILVCSTLDSLGKSRLSIDDAYNVSTAYSSLLAWTLGSYAYKKLTQPKILNTNS